jgi:hypothetical protein
MNDAHPRGLSRRRVHQLLAKAKDERSIARCIEALSRHFLGSPYQSNPLIGSAATPEVFTVSLDRFDCVTYLETVLAFARASNVDDFVEELRKIRYEHGRIEWKRRNHYMSRWIRNNVREGIIRPVSIRAIPSIIKERVLDVVPGLAARPARLKFVPKAAVSRLEPHLQSGDLIFFGSTRKHLDTFHAGIIAREDTSTRIRHASRSQGGVVEQKLSEFLKANRMAGVIVVRPQAAIGRTSAAEGGASRRVRELRSKMKSAKRGQR